MVFAHYNVVKLWKQYSKNDSFYQILTLSLQILLSPKRQQRASRVPQYIRYILNGLANYASHGYITELHLVVIIGLNLRAV